MEPSARPPGLIPVRGVGGGGVGSTRTLTCRTSRRTTSTSLRAPSCPSTGEPPRCIQTGQALPCILTGVVLNAMTVPQGTQRSLAHICSVIDDPLLALDFSVSEHSCAFLMFFFSFASPWVGFRIDGRRGARAGRTGRCSTSCTTGSGRRTWCTTSTAPSRTTTPSRPPRRCVAVLATVVRITKCSEATKAARCWARAYVLECRITHRG
jgi:hypothetical protein